MSYEFNNNRRVFRLTPKLENLYVKDVLGTYGVLFNVRIYNNFSVNELVEVVVCLWSITLASDFFIEIAIAGRLLTHYM